MWWIGRRGLGINGGMYEENSITEDRSHSWASFRALINSSLLSQSRFFLTVILPLPLPVCAITMCSLPRLTCLNSSRQLLPHFTFHIGPFDLVLTFWYAGLGVVMRQLTVSPGGSWTFLTCLYLDD